MAAKSAALPFTVVDTPKVRTGREKAPNPWLTLMQQLVDANLPEGKSAVFTLTGDDAKEEGVKRATSQVREAVAEVTNGERGVRISSTANQNGSVALTLTLRAPQKREPRKSE